MRGSDRMSPRCSEPWLFLALLSPQAPGARMQTWSRRATLRQQGPVVKREPLPETWQGLKEIEIGGGALTAPARESWRAGGECCLPRWSREATHPLPLTVTPDPATMKRMLGESSILQGKGRVVA